MESLEPVPRTGDVREASVRSQGLSGVSNSVVLRCPGVTARTVLVSLFLAALFGYCIPIVDFQMSNTFLGAMHMPAAALAALLVLLLVVNPLLNRVAKHGRFSRNEMLVVYISCLFSSLVPGRGAENFVIPTILSPFYNATQENKWLQMLSPYIKPWMSPALSDKSVAVGWYEGTQGVVPWGAWLVPLVAWSTLILAIYMMQGCLGVMLRAQWAQREALAFPLLRLPLEMTEDTENPRADGGFFRNPLVWVGASLAVFVQLMNGLHLYFPDVPEVPLFLPTGQFFTEAPWNQLGNVQIQVFPAIVGISFLLTSEVSFSLWFFHLLSKFQYILAYMCGFQVASLDSPFWTRGWAKGFIGYEQVGALLAYVALLLWTGREHWTHIAKRAFGRTSATDDERSEALSYPIAFWGFFLSLSLIVGWTIAAGVTPHVALLLWVFYLAVALALTRLVAEGGLLFVQTGWMPLGPLAFLVGAGPGKIIDVASAAPASFISAGLMLDMRGFLLPSFVQSIKLAHDRKIAMKPLMALIMGVTLVSFFLSFWTIVRLGYLRGGNTLAVWWGTGNWSQAAFHTQGLIKGLETNLAANWSWVGVGAGLTWAIMVARSRFVWFPLHPIGLLMMVPFAMHAMWVSIFLGWAAKVLITRFGGTDSYRKAIPLFLGLALGDIVMAVFWVIIDGWQGRTGHALLPF
jgi:hypothetical protein